MYEQLLPINMYRIRHNKSIYILSNKYCHNQLPTEQLDPSLRGEYYVGIIINI